MLGDLPDFDDHEMVLFLRDADAGMTAVIAIHDTTLGPAHGGTRAWAYESETAAVTDALRLSRGMTFKNALAGLPLGGGKSVILLAPGERPAAAALRAFGLAVERLGGLYLPAEDVGIGPAEVAEIAHATRHVVGVPGQGAMADADPSPWTALGVFGSIRAMLARVAGSDELRNRHVAIQGLGGVGGNLARLLAGAGARLTVADIDPARAADIAAELGADVTGPDRIHGVAADVFAPCALGGGLNAQTIPELGAGIVCGGANNQLADPEAGAMLAARGIAYAPDFVVNAGGVIWTSAPITGADEATVRARVERIPVRLADVLDRAEAGGLTPDAAAIALARNIVDEARAVRT